MTSEGSVEDGFEAVRDVFDENFARRSEQGAAVAVFHRGRKVVDLWGGTRNAAGEPWQQDTTALWMSTTKGVTATLALQLVDEGLLDVAAPVAK
jgi:CubicO group peptidase (beta-lactamase class C family)